MSNTNCVEPFSGVCEGAKITPRDLIWKLNFMVFIIAMMVWVGFCVFVVFGGIGLIALPFDFIYGFFNRPVPIGLPEYVSFFLIFLFYHFHFFGLTYGFSTSCLFVFLVLPPSNTFLLFFHFFVFFHFYLLFFRYEHNQSIIGERVEKLIKLGLELTNSGSRKYNKRELIIKWKKVYIMLCSCTNFFMRRFFFNFSSCSSFIHSQGCVHFGCGL